MRLNKRVSIWSLVLIALAVTGLIVVTMTPLVTSLLTPKPQQDFTMSPDRGSLSIVAGYSDTVTLSLGSLNGFDGNIGLTDTVAPGTNGPSVQLNPTVALSSGGGGVDQAVISTTSSMTGNYTITFLASTTTLSHSTIVSLRVTPTPPPPPPDFTLSASPASLNSCYGSILVSTITAYSISGYSGNVALTANITPVSSGTNATLTPTMVALASGGNANSTMTVHTNSTGTYTIGITGVSGTHSHLLQIPLVVGPCVGREALNMENNFFASSTNVSLWLRNTGTASITLVSYYVRDSSGNQYSLNSWNGPVIPVNNLGLAKILIGSSCPGCVLTGTAFTFTAGNSYTITVVTSRNNQFTFTVIR
jgi:hypothetical protein